MLVYRKDSENKARSWPLGPVVSFFPFSCAGLTTNVLIVFTLTDTWGAAEERPALPLLQSRDHSQRGGLISGQTSTHYRLDSHTEWRGEVLLLLTPTTSTPSPPKSVCCGKIQQYKKKEKASHADTQTVLMWKQLIQSEERSKVTHIWEHAHTHKCSFMHRKTHRILWQAMTSSSSRQTDRQT